MKFKDGKYTQAQKAWCLLYKQRTGFEPLMYDFESENESFHQAAWRSVGWFESFAIETMCAISRNIPGAEM